MKQFFIDNWPWISGILIPYIWHEYLANNPNIKSNSIAQLISNVYKRFVLKQYTSVTDLKVMDVQPDPGTPPDPKK